MSSRLAAHNLLLTTSRTCAPLASIVRSSRPFSSRPKASSMRDPAVHMPVAPAPATESQVPAENLETSPPEPKKSLMQPDKHDYFTEAAWPHPIYTRAEMEAIAFAHRNATTWSDKVALLTMRTLRHCFDFATGYHHPKPGRENDPAVAMTERKWLIRIVFLESIAGVPGMVAGMVRHLHSLRALRRDRAWIESLLEEAYNERVHLLTFLKIYNPGWFMRLMLLGGQGVFFNLFFAAYLVSPRTCHRFVGYLEEEAVLTYTRCIKDYRAGRLPEFEKLEVPDIAKQYWKMGDDCTMEDLLLYIRADEAKHREVNHTFGNLNQKTDRNPFALKVENGKPQPSKGLSPMKPTGWERDEIAA
ncbi:putative alternative oxidase AlxA [Myxozyma melibiosi]|uniref:Alternative oxidase n=1 Tax=Myxozyma melibiosi TaxID=54550 RepID=A0ABR1FFF4_9ASCO